MNGPSHKRPVLTRSATGRSGCLTGCVIIRVRNHRVANGLTTLFATLETCLTSSATRCVSTTDQKAELQIDALKAAGCDRVFTDKASGSLANRPQLDRMLDHLRPGDVVVVWRLDRLGRSLMNLIALIEDLADAGCRVPQPVRIDRHDDGQWEAVLLDHGGARRVRAGADYGSGPSRAWRRRERAAALVGDHRK